MYFKKLELFGFKSFPDKVKIVFEPGITAIVGPNGSGKTNIADAIRWILGEQSPRLLRGSRMEDVIFAGTQNRKSLGLAEAFLTLDNSQGIFSIEFSELTVGRRLFRSGESEYFINKNSCRLKDIEELFFDTGVGRRAYSLIDQEKMELILSSSPEERRTLFEEASGIMKYKVRKEEALRKLDRTERNLLRLGDIVTEVDRQLNSISRHFQKAQRYKRYKEELDDLEIKLGKKRWSDWQSVLKEKNEENTEAKSRRTELAEKINQEKAKLEELKGSLAEIDGSLSKYQTQHIVAKKELENAEDKIQLYDSYLEELEQEEKNKAVQLEFLDQKEKKREDELTEVSRRLEGLTVTERKTERELLELEDLSSQEFEESQKLKKDLEAIKLDAFESARTSAQIKNKMEMLETHLNRDLEEVLLVLYSRKKQLLSSLKLKEEELSRLKESLSPEKYFHNTEGNLAQIFKVEPKYALAAEVALVSYKTALLVRDFSSIKECFSVIKTKNLGRQKFVVLEEIPEAENVDIPDSALSGEGILGRMSDFITCEAEYKPLFDYFLDKVLVVSDADQALAVFKKGILSWTIVTLNGELFEPPAVITGGSPEEILKLASRENKINDLEVDIHNLKRDLEKIGSEEENQKIKVSKGSEVEREKLLKELEEKEKLTKALEGKLQGKESECEEKYKKIESFRDAAVNLKIELKTIKEKKASCAHIIRYLERGDEDGGGSAGNREEDLERRRKREKVLTENIENLKEKVTSTVAEIAGLEKEIENRQDEQEKLNDNLRRSEESFRKLKADEEKYQELIHNLDVEIATVKTEANNLAEKIRENYGLLLNAGEKCQPIENVDEIEGRIEFLKGRLESMGSVNLMSLDEHKELEERAQFLKAQREDLEKSRDSLLKAIQEINQTTRVLFMETFSQIQRHFFEIFRALFGGGNAKLVLQDGQNVLESGIEIIVSPPGKKLQSISLLSGGEKSLTALALLFALFKIKPSPFCVLDEIDAALDEANVHRFGALLKSFSEKTQFIVITHNKETIAVSDVIYGITMEEAGISKVVSVKLTQDRPEPALTPEAVPSA